LYPLKALREEGFLVKGYFFNPNIHPYREFERRIEALETVSSAFDLPVVWDDAVYGLKEWLRTVNMDVPFPERCSSCYEMRILRTAAKAKDLGFDAFTTTLLYSRFQVHDKIKEICARAEDALDLHFYYQDFRKGWQEGIEASKALGIYRQPYCGCLLSEGERYKKRRRNLLKRLTDS
jgi:predicted adenine nucleotide alpha hydrolase (AANH) superfamily ATPase